MRKIASPWQDPYTFEWLYKGEWSDNFPKDEVERDEYDQEKAWKQEEDRH